MRNQERLTVEIENFLSTRALGCYQFTHEAVNKVYKHTDTLSVWFHGRPNLDNGNKSYSTGWAGYEIENWQRCARETFSQQQFEQAKMDAPSLESSLQDQIKYWTNFASTQPNMLTKGNPPKVGKVRSYSTTSKGNPKKVLMAWYYSQPEVNLHACSNDELFWLIDQPIWRDYEKFNILSVLYGRSITEEVYYEHGAEVHLLVPVLEKDEKREDNYKFPFTGQEVKDLYTKYDAIIFDRSGTFFGQNGYKSKAVHGIKLVDRCKGSYTTNHKHWLKPSNLSMEALYQQELEYFAENGYYNFGTCGENLGEYILAYHAFLTEDDTIVPKEGELHQWIRTFNVLFGTRDWKEGIQDNSYKTHSYGYVSSYSGSKTHEDCGITIEGWSSRGNARILTKEGTIMFKRK